VAVVTGPAGVVAFANLWTGRVELSFDLMRYLPESESGLMDFLIVKLMLWGKEHGFQRMSLGMVPLSGLPSRPGAPLWNRLASLVYRHAEHFYNFQGLRTYKEKFDPAWHPRFLACASRAILPRVLVDLAGLSSRSYLGIVAPSRDRRERGP
jgi:phosphatidylglycerol lysyltransferase